jgi:squalene-hopene/tetraprenyl-beta-curcumene cyclase
MTRAMRNAKSALWRAAESLASRPGTAALADADQRDADVSALDACIERSAAALLAEQRRDGHWVFELEADATIPAEYVLLKRYLGEPDPAVEAKIANYLRRTQGAHGGWPLFHDGPFNISASVKAYFALKVIGDSPDAPHMQKAREAILAHGGAGTTNVFTRMLLALHDIIPWHAVPSIPVEIMFLPRWFPFHLFRISYWGRTVLAPLLVLQATKPSSRHPHGVTLDELFPSRSARIRRAARAVHQSRPWFAVFATIDAMLRFTEPHFPAGPRKRAVDKAVAFVTERLNGEDGLGAIFPAMANTVMMFDVLGYPRDHPDVATAHEAIDKLLVERHDEAYCQPCVSPVWDTVLACHALIDVGGDAALASARRGLLWLAPRQVLDTVGDWADQRPGVRPGGWAFQYANPHYPDLDDTAVVVMAMDRGAHSLEISGGADFSEAIERGREWVLGLQSRNGGWGAFDADNTSEYLNHIPFADHGALLDPPTADVTARCASMLAQLGTGADRRALDAALAYLRRTQETNGSWHGRWGMNYIYGTWSALCAFNAAGVSPQAPEIRRAVKWLEFMNNPDGGWGEHGSSYELDHRGHLPAPSTASQTAWALLGLMAAGEVDNPVVGRGIDYLLRSDASSGHWPEPHFTATGFPRVFYLRYHGYSKFFPLWALARYRNLRGAADYATRLGM